MRRWAVDEMGRNSVIPWVNPSTTACKKSTAGTIQLNSGGQLSRLHPVDLAGVVAHVQGALAVDVDGDPLDDGAVALDPAAAAQVGVAAPARDGGPGSDRQELIVGRLQLAQQGR